MDRVTLMGAFSSSRIPPPAVTVVLPCSGNRIRTHARLIDRAPNPVVANPDPLPVSGGSLRSGTKPTLRGAGTVTKIIVAQRVQRLIATTPPRASCSRGRCTSIARRRRTP